MSDTKARQLDSASFQSEIIDNRRPAMVDFWATWCGPCRQMAPMIDEMSGRYEDRVLVAKLDIDQHAELAVRYGIRAAPTLLFFVDGEVVDRLVGVPSRTVLETRLELLSRAAA